MIHSMQRDRERRLRRKPRRKRGLVAGLMALTGVALLGNLLTSPHLEEPTTDHPPGYRPPVEAASRVMATLPPVESSDARAAAAALSLVDSLPPAPRVAYAVTVTEEPKASSVGFLDGAAVLAQSVRKAHKRSSYGAPAFVAFVSPRISRKTRSSLRGIGFRSVEKQLPISPERIEGSFLRKLWTEPTEKFPDPTMRGGCCGAWELLKLYAWTLTEYERVVHVDMDCLLLHPIDELLSIDASLVYTADYNMMNDNQRKNKLTPAVQGGFLVVRPSLDVFQALVALMQKGKWGGKCSGWECTGVGHWWGGATIQGLLPYFYDRHAKTLSLKRASDLKAVEVDRCIYDNMGDKAVVNPLPYVGCSAARQTPFDSVKFAHFTVCQKPWTCNPARDPDDTLKICLKLHAAWFDVRRQFEVEHGMPSEKKVCRRGYRKMAFPAGFGE